MNYSRFKCVLSLNILLLIFWIKPVSAFDSTKIYGVTLDAVDNLKSITNALKNHSKKMTARIVFDNWVKADSYTEPCKEIKKVSYIMGELLDSYDFSKYSYSDYVNRVNDYFSILSDQVDIWEIGNEVNGEWCGPIDSVVHKIQTAYQIAKSRSKIVSLTLYYNYECWENPENEMFRWINERLPLNLKDSIDYLFVSYYEEDCNEYQPEWQKIFDSLHIIFPHSKLGIGECGTEISNKKASLIRKYYTMNITTQGYIGGYFWWYYKKDCVPSKNQLWKTLDDVIKE